MAAAGHLGPDLVLSRVPHSLFSPPHFHPRPRRRRSQLSPPLWIGPEKWQERVGEFPLWSPEVIVVKPI